MRWALERLEREGSPLMQGAAGAVRVLLGQEAPEAFGERLGSWVDVGGVPGARVEMDQNLPGGQAARRRRTGALLGGSQLCHEP
jgi:hypothetical protein